MDYNQQNPGGDPNVSDKIASDQETQGNVDFENELHGMLRGIIHKFTSVPGKSASEVAGGLKQVMGLYQSLADGVNKHLGNSSPKSQIVKNAVKSAAPENKPTQSPAPAQSSPSSQPQAMPSMLHGQNPFTQPPQFNTPAGAAPSTPPMASNPQLTPPAQQFSAPRPQPFNIPGVQPMA